MTANPEDLQGRLKYAVADHPDDNLAWAVVSEDGLVAVTCDRDGTGMVAVLGYDPSSWQDTERSLVGTFMESVPNSDDNTELLERAREAFLRIAAMDGSDQSSGV